ncbi:IS30 family transposase [Patescibacteria group bacterium]|nr:IS30 family transposase [Patescibacteria group bacterium]
MTYQQFSIEEREKIQEMLWAKVSLRAIARLLKRSPSSISRELARNRPPERNRYAPRVAHERAMENRKKRGREERLKNDQMREYVVSHLKLGWSPEQIAATAKGVVGASISYEAVYQFVYARVSQASNLMYRHQEDLRPYLARHRRQRMHKGMRKPYRIEKGPLPSIETRPVSVDARRLIGHWEDDSIVCSPTIPVRLRTANERRSGLVFIDKAHDRTMAEANRITMKRFANLPPRLRRTLTRDRGAENMGYEELERKLGITCFFAHAYSSWERGSNENLNGLVRRFFPKKTDFRTISDEEIRMVERLLNSRPRKRLGWKTPYQVFYELTGVALEG